MQLLSASGVSHSAVSTVIQEVATPLQLAALFLILLAGVIRFFVRSGKGNLDPSLTRLIINRCFQAGLIALILGVISPLAVRMLPAPQHLLSGQVVSPAGEPVPRAVVSVPPLGQDTSDGEGRFHIVLPSPLAKGSYQLNVSAPGFSSSQSNINLPTAKDLVIALTPSPMEVTWDPASTLRVGQFYGAAMVMIRLHVHNNSDTQHTLQVMDAESSDGKRTIALNNIFFTLQSDDGMYLQAVMPQLPIEAHQTFDLRLLIGNDVPLPILMQTLSALPEYRNESPCTGTLRLTDDAFAAVSQFANEHFTWSAGNWTFHIGIATDAGQQYNFSKRFQLSDADITHLKESVELIRECTTINPIRPFAQSGTYSNYFLK